MVQSSAFNVATQSKSPAVVVDVATAVMYEKLIPILVNPIPEALK
jgi:hypothetical protein